MSSVSLCYQQKLHNGDFVADPMQLQAVNLLNDLAIELIASPQQTVKGLYIWGDVGRGKTALMDMFFDSIADDLKLRLHFHHFMAKMHRELNLESGHAEPLRRIAKRLATQCRVLCFDEFFVSDIGDAMILGRLFEALFEFGVTLVATSNIPIAKLYQNGLQRQRFEPTIALLQQFTTEFHLNGAADHRLRHLNFEQTYFQRHEMVPEQLFGLFAQNSEQLTADPVTILGRNITVQQRTSSTIWFKFTDICDGPRSALDYIELSKHYERVIITELPLLGGECRTWIRARGTEDGSEATTTGERQLSYAAQDDPTRRFISLVDELYDQQVNLYLIADVALADLYGGGALSFEFKRTFSRLTEMQSSEYLAMVAS